MQIGYMTEKAISADAAQLCLFAERKESDPAAWFYRSSPLRYSGSQGERSH